MKLEITVKSLFLNIGKDESALQDEPNAYQNYELLKRFPVGPQRSLTQSFASQDNTHINRMAQANLFSNHKFREAKSYSNLCVLYRFVNQTPWVHNNKFTLLLSLARVIQSAWWKKESGKSQDLRVAVRGKEFKFLNIFWV